MINIRKFTIHACFFFRFVQNLQTIHVEPPQHPHTDRPKRGLQRQVHRSGNIGLLALGGIDPTKPNRVKRHSNIIDRVCDPKRDAGQHPIILTAFALGLILALNRIIHHQTDPRPIGRLINPEPKPNKPDGDQRHIISTFLISFQKVDEHIANNRLHPCDEQHQTLLAVLSSKPTRKDQK